MEPRKTYPLTPTQNLIFLAQKFTVHKQLMNIPTSCLLDENLDPELLQKAAAEAVLRNDALAIRITKNGKDCAQYFADRKVLLLEIMDFTGKTNAEMVHFFQKTGETKMALYDSPLCKIYVIRSPEGKSGLFICVSHIIMDSWAISTFYRDIFNIYDALANKEAMPKPLSSYETALQKEIDYLSSDRYKRDYEFWNNEISGPPPIFTHVNGTVMLEKWRKFKRDPEYRFGRSLYFRTTARHVVRMVEKEDVDKMKAFCTENGIPSMQALFFFGIRTAIARVNDRQKDVAILSVAARRATLEEKNCGGTRATALPLRTIMEEDMPFTDALHAIIEKQTILFRHADMDIMKIFAIGHKNYGYSPLETYTPLHFTFQPVTLEIHGRPTSTQWYCNGSAGSNAGLSVMDGDGTGALRCYYEYHDRVIKPETLEKIHDYMVRVILAGVEKPDIRMKDLLDIPV